MRGVWYGTTSPDAGYSCGTSADGPYRKAQVLLDDHIAGISVPYPYIYTGGWSNPFLWYAIPAPRAFNIQAIRYDRTRSWGCPPTVRAPPDAGADDRGAGRPVGLGHADELPGVARLPQHADHRTAQPPAWRAAQRRDSYVEGDTHQVDVDAAHRFRTVGWLDTSHGRVVTTVEQALANQNEHYWGSDERPDAQQVTWTDTSTVTVSRPGAPGRTAPATTGSNGRTVLSVGERGRVAAVVCCSDGP
nr:peptide-N4-asparagine amidase [Micromonospora aurantiaca]